jgi:hypothetical protein
LTASRVRFVTSPEQNCFIGFHDIIPWSADGRVVALQRMPADFRDMEDTDKAIEIALWTPETGAIEAIDTTRAWNFQQGARVQWLPGSASVLLFNDVIDGVPLGILRDVATGERRVLEGAIHVIDPTGSISIAPDFVDLAVHWPAYGYRATLGHHPDAIASETGLWEVDLTTGKRRLFLTIERVVSEMEEARRPIGARHFLSHPLFSPDGKHVVFVHRFFLPDGSLFTRFLVTDRQARTITVLAEEKSTHFDWWDNETLLVWARFAGALGKARSRGILQSPIVRPLIKLVRAMSGRWKKRLLAESYFKVPIANPAARSRFGWPDLDSDGHPMFARSHRWLLTDTYPDGSEKLPLILYHLDEHRRVDVAWFEDGVTSAQGDAKCDLHPRWNRDETMIAVDTCEAGLRQVQLVDVRDIVAPGTGI